MSEEQQLINRNFFVAIDCGDIKLARSLAGRVDVDNTTDFNGYTRLGLYAITGKHAMMRVLATEFNADVNKPTKYGETPIHLAASGTPQLAINSLLSVRILASLGRHQSYGRTSGRSSRPM
jgi:ankyrin repeat protein